MYMYLEALESPEMYRYNDITFLFLNLLKPSVGKELSGRV